MSINWFGTYLTLVRGGVILQCAVEVRRHLTEGENAPSDIPELRIAGIAGILVATLHTPRPCPRD